MARYIDAEKLENLIRSDFGKLPGEKVPDKFRETVKEIMFGVRETILAYLDGQDEEDVAPVVRCKDCKYCKPQQDYLFCEQHTGYPSGDYFCASGEAKEKC